MSCLVVQMHWTCVCCCCRCSVWLGLSSKLSKRSLPFRATRTSMVTLMLVALVISNPYALKDSGPTSDMTAWTSAGLQPTTGYYPYDPTLAAYGSDRRLVGRSANTISCDGGGENPGVEPS
uniref:Uncharacterized protein n=1 Tax=Anopheles atroparvus TaxID=41427 RepID=A0A182J1S3_ANOAO